MKIHFIGICGTLMGNAAILLSQMNHQIKGSDDGYYPPISEALANSKIECFQGFSEHNLEWNPDLIIIGNAISRGNPELEFVLRNSLNFISMSEFIKKFLIKDKHSIVITGTHGKTTTTALISSIFRDYDKDSSYIIGGIPKNKKTGFSYCDHGKYFIIEGDEYDTAFFDKRSKFIHYKPQTLIINNLEYDHADIFDSLAEIKKSFRHLIKIIPDTGAIIANFDDQNVMGVVQPNFSKLITYGFNEGADYQIKMISADPCGTKFSVSHQGQAYQLFTKFQGKFQLYNMTAAFIAAQINEIPLVKIEKSISAFEGVKKRMEHLFEWQGSQFIFDFAHHPTAIEKVLKTVRKIHPNKKLIAVFEPRSNTSRRKIFQKELTASLGIADTIFIGKIDREWQLSAEEKLDINLLTNNLIQKGKKAFYEADVKILAKKILENLEAESIVLIMSNGSFDNLVGEIRSKLIATL